MSQSPILPIRLYGRPGCHLCDEARASIAAILLERELAGLAAPPIEERDITTNPRWERAYLETIPVLEIGGRELTLATSSSAIRRLLAEVLDAGQPVRPMPGAADGPDAGPGLASQLGPR